MVRSRGIPGLLIERLIEAAINGMFRDIEGPKYTMLETERDLDSSASATPSASASGTTSSPNRHRVRPASRVW
mgnify:CR=1 FL=1